MVQLNKNDRTITITAQGDISDLVYMQKGLIDLMRCYDWNNYGDSESGTSFYSALELLEALLPSEEQQQRGLVSEANYLELPENLNEKQVQNIREALFMVSHPETKVRKERNPVHEAIKSLEI